MQKLSTLRHLLQLSCRAARIRRHVRGWHIVSDFTPLNELLAKIRIKAKFHNISLICTQAAIEAKDDAVKDALYANLEKLYDKCPAHDIKIVLGDFNAKFGQEGIFGLTVSSRGREAIRFRRGAKHGSL